MKVYSCKLSGAEMLSDNNATLQEEGDVVYVVKAKMVEVGGEDFGIGANADEDADEGATGEAVQDEKKKVLDLVNNYRLQETVYDKDSYKAHLKSFFREVAKANGWEEGSDEQKAFQKRAGAWVMPMLKRFDDLCFYTGELHEDVDPDKSTIALAIWDDDGMGATFYFWKDALKAEKV